MYKSFAHLTVTISSALKQVIQFDAYEFHLALVLRVGYLCRSLIIVYTQCGQRQASFIREKSACLLEVSAMERILQKFPSS